MPSLTPQDSLSPIDRDEETVHTGVTRNPTQVGGMVYRTDTGSFEFEDAAGYFDPRSGFNTPLNPSNVVVLGVSAVSGEDTHTSKNPVTTNSLSVAIIQDVSAFLFVSYVWSVGSDKEDFNARVTLDSTVIGTVHKQEGESKVKKKEKTDQRLISSRIIPVSLLAANPNTLELQHYANKSSYEVSIWESTLLVFKVI